MTRWLKDVQAGIGRSAAWAALALVAAGATAFVTGLGGGGAPRAFAALIASWLFFAGAAAGALAFRAFFRIVDARWARPVAALAGIPIGFAPVAMLLLVVIVVGASAAPWLRPAEADAAWLTLRSFTVRELAANGVLFGLAAVALRPRPGSPERPTRAMAVVYCLVYAVVLSVWAFDFVLGPAPVFASTLIGPFVFMGAFVAGTGTAVLVALARGAIGEPARRDAAALVLALAIFWAYLFWSQYLTFWYGNQPDEIGWALLRLEAGWDVVVLAAVALVFVVPFVALLHSRGRRSARVLGGLLAAQLVGLWLCCHLLIVPSLAPGSPLDARDVLVGLGMLGAFVLSWAGALGRDVAAAAAPSVNRSAAPP